MQDASGPVVDTLGGLSLTVGGTPLFQQSATNHTRKAIRSSADGNTASLASTDTALPDIASSSCFAWAVIDMPTAAPAAARNLIELGTNATRAACQYTTASKVQAVSVANTANGTAVPTSRVMPIALKVDRAGSAVKVYTDQEVLTPTFDGAMAGKRFNLLAVPTGQASALCGYLYAARWDGANAEAFTDAETKKLFQAHGSTVLW
jgi:hypothetical protein